MRLDIVPGIGIGPVRRGVSPAQVLEVFPEDRQYKDRMGDNLDDSLLFKGLVFTFDQCKSHGPLPNVRLEQIAVHGREDATSFGRPVRDWNRDAILARLRQEGHVVDEMANGCIGIMAKLERCFAASGELDWVEIYVY